jgi:osmoprotectant transport system ATP-binding protein
MRDPQEPGAAEVVIEHVWLRRGARPVLNGVSLSVARGETVVLVGRSGAGKSSILKLINRMLVPDDGRVIVRGRATAEWDPFELRRGTGYVLQEVGLFPHLTVQQNVGIVPRLLGWTEPRINARTAEMLDLVGLGSSRYAARPPSELSGGERQRVGVARALAADPPLLLMDEPFGALDPITRSELHQEFLQIQRRLGKTVVIVTHDMAEAFALASRIAVVHDGTLVALGTPAALLKNQHPEVQALLAPLIEAGAALRDSR